jgi:DNA-binding NarL/FixJ family response regulator
MLATGAAAYVLKNEAGADLIAARPSSAPRWRRRAGVVTCSRPTVVPTWIRLLLTGREREVLGFLVRGSRTREIAAELGISIKTVETYRGRIMLMLKLGIDNLAGLVKFAIRAGIAPVEWQDLARHRRVGRFPTEIP